MIIGYSRISDSSQCRDTQLDVLERYNCDMIVEETISGIEKEKELNKIVREMKENDTLVVPSVNRLGRSMSQIILLIEELNDKNCHLVISDLGVDTRTPSGKLVAGVMAAISEYERSILKEKQLAGIAAAKRSGKHLGRKSAWSKEAMEEAVKLYEEGLKTVKEIEKIYKIPPASFYRGLKKYRQNLLIKEKVH